MPLVGTLFFVLVFVGLGFYADVGDQAGQQGAVDGIVPGMARRAGGGGLEFHHAIEGGLRGEGKLQAVTAKTKGAPMPVGAPWIVIVGAITWSANA